RTPAAIGSQRPRYLEGPDDLELLDPTRVASASDRDGAQLDRARHGVEIISVPPITLVLDPGEAFEATAGEGDRQGAVGGDRNFDGVSGDGPPLVHLVGLSGAA